MHCSPPQQKMMADMFKDILVDIFVLDPDNPLKEYPSPHDLKGKFIIKESRERIIKIDSPFKISEPDGFGSIKLRFSGHGKLDVVEESKNSETLPIGEFDADEDEDGKFHLTF